MKPQVRKLERDYMTPEEHIIKWMKERIKYLRLYLIAKEIGINPKTLDNFFYSNYDPTKSFVLKFYYGKLSNFLKESAMAHYLPHHKVTKALDMIRYLYQKVKIEHLQKWSPRRRTIIPIAGKPWNSL